MDNVETLGNPVLFWVVIYAISITIGMIWIAVFLIKRMTSKRQLTWDLHTEYIDISEFSNRNVPLNVTYKGTEPRFLWASYVCLKNTGTEDILPEDHPDKQHLIAGAEDCRYIGFNRLISLKAKVTLNPLFKGNDVYCKIEFDKLGPGDEILMSLLYIADEKKKIEIDGKLFGANSKIISGYISRMQAWRSLWWLLITMIIAGIIGGTYMVKQTIANGELILFHFQALVIMYLLAIITASVLLRPIRFWQQIPERFNVTDYKEGTPFARMLKFLFGLEKTP